MPDTSADSVVACGTCEGSGIQPWDLLTLPQRHEWSKPGGRLVACSACEGTGFAVDCSICGDPIAGHKDVFDG